MNDPVANGSAVTVPTGMDGRPTLFFHKNCTRLVDCLPNLQHDPARPEDVLKVDTDDDGIGGDDAADALRYLVAPVAVTSPPGN
jgi:hypothetical protein